MTIPKKEPPGDLPGGNGKPFYGYAGSRHLELPREAFASLILGLAGSTAAQQFGTSRGRTGGRPCTLRNESPVTQVSRFGSLLASTHDSQSGAASPLHPARSPAIVKFGPSRNPSALETKVGETFGIPSDQPGKLPFSSPPRRATVSRSPTWPACPLPGTLPHSI